MSQIPSSQQSPSNGLAYDPDQDVHEKREIRRNYRLLHKALDDPHARHTPAELHAKVDEANEIFENVKDPQEAVLDSSFLVKTTTATSRTARALRFGTGTFNIDDFVTRLITFMGGYKPPEEITSDASDLEEEDDSPLDWAKVGRRALARSRRVPAAGFMMGPLSLEQKQRAPKQQRAKFEKNKNDETKPQSIREEDISRSENETTKNVAIVAALLEQIDKINLFRLVINPNSFSQSLENIFYLSFLIRDAKVAFQIDDDGEPLVFACEEVSDQDRETGVLLKRQLIFEFDMATWRRAIEVFEITEPFIPTRPRAKTRLGQQWYG
ncbi:Nse4 C-terminal-domain-containing protein [Mycena alexandri]|uniref:Non-structural maintenance of chromosomes element 4 n=1 Tax=Mycena alexandri TaxID=1745969 RepID=A0AAD6X848_9AGAR|nr:Nse4 C-terminal-domain-containing protein [Mycena alexandri]